MLGVPEQPAPSDVRLLHLYGIDCLYWLDGDDFRRLELCGSTYGAMAPKNGQWDSEQGRGWVGGLPWLAGRQLGG